MCNLESVALFIYNVWPALHDYENMGFLFVHKKKLLGMFGRARSKSTPKIVKDLEVIITEKGY